MKKLFCIAACVVLLASPAFAQQRGQRGFGQRGQRGQRVRLRDPMVAALDANRDGTVSAKELANAPALLKKLDRNGNGSIDRDELREAMRSAMGMGGSGGPAGGRGGIMGGLGGGSSTLERSGLKLGQQMPNVSIYDAQGERFKFADARGKYAVVVFGCLT